MRKQEIKNKLIDGLVEDDLLDEFDLDNKIEIQDDGADSAVKYDWSFNNKWKWQN